MKPLIKVSLRQLAEIAEQSPGYEVITGANERLTAIRFRRHASGRRNKACVEASLNGRPAAFPAGTTLFVED